MPLLELLEHANALEDSRVRKDSVLSAEVIELIGLESGVTLQFESEARDARRRPLLPPEQLAKLPLRSPVVTLMGHVDHGKTSMLDAFRGSALAADEAGGITQTISAFQVDSGSSQAATFIDTPGHEFFSAMRHRGATATDIVLLIVALDAGVQPTTIQAIELAKEMGVPIVVAANKVDRYGNAERLPQVQQQLLANGLHPEELGGDIPVIAASATQGLHLDTLRETLQLHAEMLELHAEDTGPAEGVVLEAQMQKGLGVLATVLVQRGELRPGDDFVAGLDYGRVKVLQGESGRPIKHAGPSTPVRVSGFRELPRAGDEFLVVNTEARAREVCEYRRERHHVQESLSQQQRLVGRTRKSAKLVPFLLKADTQGALEAVQQGLSHFPKDVVELTYVRTGVGPLSEADIDLARELGATVLGYNLQLANKLTVAAERAEVALHAHKIIYELVDAAKLVLEAAIPPRVEELVRGTLEVQEVFELTLKTRERKEGMKKRTHVAGGKVTGGEVAMNTLARVTRGEEVVHEGKVISLRHFKEEVRKVNKGTECGVILNDATDLKAGDLLTCYEVVSRKIGLYDSAEEGGGQQKRTTDDDDDDDDS